MLFRNKFKKFGGDYIPDIVLYLQDYLKSDPDVTISVGCDSIQKRKRTIFACTIMLYNSSIRNGAHVVFFRENLEKIRNNFERLGREAQYCYDVAMFLDTELSKHFIRRDLSSLQRKRYKFHLEKCNGNHLHLPIHQETQFINRIHLTHFESTNAYRLVDIHLDFNSSEIDATQRGLHKNKSYQAYTSFVPWLRGSNFRVFVKPESPASSSAADLLLQD